MDVVVVSHAEDAHLLRIFLASYELYFEDRQRLLLIVDRANLALWQSLPLPANTELVFREDFPELGADDFRNQLYLKLISYRLVTSNRFLVCDSDFVFLAPCRAADWFSGGVPVWFYCEWTEAGSRFRAGSETVLGRPIGWQYMTIPQYVLDREIGAALASEVDPAAVLRVEGASEYVLWGAYSHARFPERYCWVRSESPEIAPIGLKVNQLPPTYLHLDPDCRYEQFAHGKYAIFWSHWDLAETKMREFFRESQLRHFGRVRSEPAADRLFLTCVPESAAAGCYRGIRGIDSDGWLRQTSWFALPPRVSGWQLRILAPADPANGRWRLCGLLEVNGASRKLDFPPGWHTIAVPGGGSVVMAWDQGFEAGGRRFYARLEGIDPV